MFNHVIVPLDGSRDAEAALAPALRLLDGVGELHLLSVTRREDWEDRNLYLKTLAEDLAVRSTTATLLFGDPATRVAEIAESWPGAIVCIASSGHGSWLTGVFGSVALDLVRATSGPVVVVGPHFRATSSRFRTLLAAVDGSARAEQMLPAALELSHRLGLEFRLVRVAAPAAWGSTVEWEVPPTDDDERSYLAGLADDLEGQGVVAGWEVIHGPVVPTALASHASGFPNPILAIATHARHGLGLSFWGSVATQLVHDATFPVVMFNCE